MEQKVSRNVNAVAKVKAIFKAHQSTLTLAQIKEQAIELKSNEISMALCYLMRQRYATRTQIENSVKKMRKSVWLYTFYENKLPKEENV
jgi:hypothetical protein